MLPPTQLTLAVPFFAFCLPDDVGDENTAAGNVADLEDVTVVGALLPADDGFFGEVVGSVSERLTQTSSSSNGIGFLLAALVVLVVLSSGVETPIPVADVILLVIGRISTREVSKNRLSR